MEAQTHEFSSRQSPWMTVRTKLKPLILTGVAVLLYMVSLNLPWVQTYVSHRVAGNPVSDLGHWLLMWLFIAVLAAVTIWLISDRKTFSYAIYFGVFGVSLVVLGWMANDRFDMNQAFDQLDVLWNVIVVALATAAIFLVGMAIRWRQSRS